MGATGRAPRPGETLFTFAVSELEALEGQIVGRIHWQAEGPSGEGWALAPFRPARRPTVVLAVAAKVYASGGLYWSKVLDETAGPYNPKPVGPAFLGMLTELDSLYAGNSPEWRKRNQ